MLQWFHNDKVRGSFFDRYNTQEIRLYLDEWDSSLGDVEGGAVSARVSLRKVAVNGRVQWQGRMFNMDKRNFTMSFARTGSTGTGSSNKNELEKKLR